MIPQKNPLIASGESVHANMLTKLWENPDPTANFAAQRVNLSSDDYDFLLWIFRYATTVHRDLSVITKKGDGFTVTAASVGGSGIYNIYRDAIYYSDTAIDVYNCTLQFAGQTGAQDNARLLPIAVYGLKKSLDITAIVSNVSTDARLCMLSDGVTDVESKFGSVDTNIANRLPVYKAVSASNIPTGAEVLAALQSLGNKQSIVVNFYNSEDTILYSSMYYCQTNVSYGAGILVSYYGGSFYKVKNANGTVTLTSF